MRASALARTVLLAGVAVLGRRDPGRRDADHVRSPERLVQRFWCADWISNGRTTLLDTGEGPTTVTACVGFETCAFAAQVRIAGRYVADIYREPGPQYNDGIDSVEEFDVRAGPMVVNGNTDPSLSASETTPGAGQAAFDGIIKLVLNDRGDLVWLVNGPPDSR